MESCNIIKFEITILSFPSLGHLYLGGEERGEEKERGGD